jgi:CheY-like chemotaxis protein
MTEGLRIVIVEDDGIIAVDLAELLVGMGHDVCAMASTEGEAEAAAARCQPDLMIVDGSLRNGSGVEAMFRILNNGDTAHFYVTGNPWAVRELVPDAIVLTKPFTMRDLERGIVSARQAAKQRADLA